MSLLEPALEWLAPRLERVPPRLADAVRACVRRSVEDADPEAGADVASAGDAGSGPDGVLADGPEPPSVPRLLARAAVAEFRRVPELRRDREAAVRLLAADAILTYAFEAAAELGDDVVELADAVGLRGRMGECLRRLSGPDREPEPAGEAPVPDASARTGARGEGP